MKYAPRQFVAPALLVYAGRFPSGIGNRLLAALALLLSLLPGCHGSGARPQTPPSMALPPQPATAAIAPARFVDVTRQAGIDFIATNAPTPHKYLIETMGSGCAFIDYDNDGWPDILLLNGAALPGSKVAGRPTLKLFHNNRDGTFTDVTRKAGLDQSIYAMGCAVGDYDNDGYDDIYITCALGSSRLYHNNGNGTFTDVTARAGVANRGMWGTSCAWVDVDNDGYLDLFVCNYVLYRSLADDLPCTTAGIRTYCLPENFRTSHCTLYHNNGDGTFTDISGPSGIAAGKGKSLGVAIWDYDDDGLPDIYVANDTVAGFLFHNLGHNRFEEVGVQSGLAYDEQGQAHSGMGIDVGDLYNDGRSSVVLTNYSGQQTCLYDQVSVGIYEDHKAASGVGPPSLNTLGFGAGFCDYDNDGYKDLMVVNGHVQDTIARSQPNVSYAEPPLLYHNERNGHFCDVSERSGAPFTTPLVARGLAWGDYDNDGKVDLLVTTNGGRAYLWQNRTPQSGHWLILKLTGVRCNRDGIGARVRVTSEGRTQTGMVRSGSSYLSAGDLRLHFGLGAAARADIEVKWPDGLMEHFPMTAVDRVARLQEGAGAPVLSGNTHRADAEQTDKRARGRQNVRLMMVTNDRIAEGSDRKR